MNEKINRKPTPKTTTDLFYSFVGTRIRERRTKMGWSLIYLGEKVGLSHQQLQKYEQGEVHLSAERLFKVGMALEVPCDYFYKGYEKLLEPDQPPLNESDKIISVRSTPLSVLIIESDPLEEVYTREILEECSVPLRIFSLHCNGYKILELLKNKRTTRKFPLPDIILMELDLPELDGVHILRDLKRDPLLKEIPVIILSNNLSRRLMKESYKNHASGYVRKSFDGEIFKEHLHATIKYWSSVCLPRM